ncbi:MAG: amino acid adenylation domain-containing protein, partial [Ruminococcus sp.]|nr:amino acid adenylation domain-containing protein [Ruminococcus sp.]
KSKKDGWTFINTIRHIKEKENDVKYIYESIGILDFENVINTSLANIGISGKRVSIPTYVFDAIPYPICIEDSFDTSTVRSSSSKSNQIVNKVAIVISDLSEMEDYVVYAYKEVFGFETIDMDGDFFANGGDSLKAVSLAAVIKNKVGINVDVNDIFTHTTPKRLAAYLFENYNAVSQIQEAILPIPTQDYYVISSAQRRMYTMYLMDKDSLAYNLPSATIISGGLEKERVIETVRKMMQRHELLRSSFDIVDGEIVQIIHDDIEDIPVRFTTGKIDTEYDFKKIVDNFVKVFDLKQAPLFRMEIVDIGDNQQMLLFDVHHIIADGTSVEILTRDFNTLYFGELEPLRIQYKDFAFWQNENMNSEKIQKQEEYWLNQLQGELPVLDLPTDYKRPEISKLTGKRVKFEFDEKADAAIHKLSAKYGTTNFMVMLSIWYVLLAHYTAQDDIIIGTPVSGRTMEDVQETIGMFVNMLALRNYPEADKYYSDFLLEVKENTLKALNNQDYPFDTLVERINVQRKLNRNAVFDVSFDYHNMELHDLEINGMTFKSQEIDSCSVSVDLILTCYEENNHINGCIDYSTELFKEETVERMISHYIQILSYVAENQECKISEIPLTTKNDMEIICKQFEKVDSHESNNVLIHELFEQKAAKIPNEIALITSSGKVMTYSELNREANRIAWQLRKNGISENDCVGIMAERNEELVISILAVLKSGGTYTAIDTSYPYERIDYMIKQSNMNHIICSKIFSELAEKFTGVMYFNELCTGDNINNLPPVNNSESNAYIIFTSGSTGMPKGVMVKHSNVVNLIRDHRNRNLFTDIHDRIACLASPSFDIFVFETIIPLCCGGSIYMANREEQLDTVLLSHKILEHNITYIQASVSRLRAMSENSQFKEAIAQLKVIVGGGETYPLSLVKHFQNITPARLFNMYGPTETTVTATIKELTDSDYVTIGSPIDNAQVLILDENLKIQPVGVFGELCISGEGVSNGYINNPEETKKRFILFDLTETKKIFLYRTGDRARLLANGEVELAGRIDNQVKIRGYRVELDEIEKTAMLLESVSYAVAKVFTNENGNTQLVLFFSTPEYVTDTNSVHDALSELFSSRLPAYMIPSSIVFMKNMPVLNNGKIDRKALTISQNINDVKTAVNVGNNRQHTRIESQIQNVWKDVLNVKSISLNDNFFDIGGNSYTLMLV